MKEPKIIRISSEELLKIWQCDYKNNKNYEKYYNNIEFTMAGGDFEPEIRAGDIMTEWVIIENHVIRGLIKIENIAKESKLIDLILKNCEIDEGFLIRNSHIGSISCKNCKIGKFDFQNNSDCTDLNLNEDSKIGAIFLGLSSIVESVTISESIVEKITLSNKSLIKKLTLNEKSFCKNVSSLNSTINTFFALNFESPGEINFSQSQIENITISKSRLNQIFIDLSNCGSIIVGESAIINNFTIKNGATCGNIKFGSASILEAFSIKDSSITRDISINDKAIINNIIIVNNSCLGCLIISGGKCTEDISITNSRIKGIQIVDSSSIVNLNISGKTMIGDILLKNSVVIGSLIIRSFCKVGNVDFVSTIVNGFISVDDNSFTHRMTFDSTTINNDFNISYQSEIKGIRIDNASSFSDVFVSNSIITDNFILTNKSKSNNISILEESTAFAVIIDQASIVKSLKIDEGSKIGDITIFEKSTCTQLNIFDSKIFSLLIADCTIDKPIFFYNTDFETIQLGNINNLESLSIKGNIRIGYINLFERISFDSYIDGSTIGRINFDQRVISKDTIVVFSNCYINILYFNLTQNFGSLYFNNCSDVKELIVWELPEKKKLVQDVKWDYITNSIKRESEIKFINSDLGRTSFVGCDFSKFDKFEFFNSNLLGIRLIGSIFPRTIKIPTEVDVDYLSQLRLANSQFKKIFEASGDNVTAYEFMSKELENYRKQLLIEGKRRNWIELINLWFQKYTSTYGTNWFRSLVITKSVLIIGFTLYCILMGNIPGTDMKLFVHNFSYIGGFLNPVHKNETLESEIMQLDKMSISVSLARIVGDITRLLLAIMIFQTIQAFRKHARR